MRLWRTFLLLVPLFMVCTGVMAAAPVHPFLWNTAKTANPISADPLIVDLSSHLVAITTGFSGASVLLFGALEQPGDIVVIVRGPPRDEVIRHKERVFDIWVNRAMATVNAAPSYFWIAATRPLEETLPPSVRNRYHIDGDHLDIRITRHDDMMEDSDYRQAFLRLKQRAGLYNFRLQSIAVLENRLFWTKMDFPANIPTGNYSVEVYLLRNGEVMSAKTTVLSVDKTGISAEIFDFAHHQAALYGLMAILVAALAGWLAAIAFRRR